jgi:hypothetical protein
MGVLLAGVITCCWLIAGIVAVVALAVRATQRRRGQQPPGHRPERARLILAALALTAVTLPLLLGGWSVWSWSAGGLALVGAGLLAPKLATASYAHRLAMLPVLACLGGAGFAVYTVWQRLLTLGGGGRVLAFWVAALTVVLFITLFAVCVREAVTRTLAWCRRGSEKRWLVPVGLCAVTLVLPVFNGLWWWFGVPGIMLLAIAIGMYQLGETEGGEGHVLTLLGSVMAGLYLLWFVVSVSDLATGVDSF